MGYQEQINLCMKNFSEMREVFGTSVFDAALRKFNQQRVSPTREKRIKFPPKMYQRLFDMQKGICPRCKNHLDVPAKRNAIDHINPHIDDSRFNRIENLRLCHSHCNGEKSANTVFEESKATGQPVDEILRGGRTDEDEHSYHEEENEP